GQSGNTLTNVTPGTCYWINAIRTCTLTLEGDRYDPPTVPVVAGWNPIAFPGTAWEDMSGLSTVNPNMVSVWTFDNQFKRNRHFHSGAPPALNTLAGLAPDTAALVQCSADGTLNLPAK